MLQIYEVKIQIKEGQVNAVASDDSSSFLYKNNPCRESKSQEQYEEDDNVDVVNAGINGVRRQQVGAILFSIIVNRTRWAEQRIDILSIDPLSIKSTKIRVPGHAEFIHKHKIHAVFHSADIFHPLKPNRD